jgi:TetR/AcrR family transcriptional repressor of nem operon
MSASAASEDRPRAGAGQTSGRILDVAEELAQVRGFNSFSYSDVARRLEITTASVHYHFPAKADLGSALVGRYHGRFAEALEWIDRSGGLADERIDAYVSLYAEVLRSGRMCLCGMLAAEYQTLPAEMRNAIIGFFDENEDWLTEVLNDGREEGALAFQGPAREKARTLIGGLEGAMLVARTYGDVERFTSIAAQLAADLSSDMPAISSDMPAKARSG